MKRTLFLTSLLLLQTLSFAQLAGLSIQGDPVAGATWTYKASDNGTTYDLEGILLKPPGNGPFPAVIINHGTGFTVYEYSQLIAETMVTWGYVCIATNYTHAGKGACGSPGSCEPPEFGASQANILRAIKCWDILASLNYVDTMCVKAFGHSRGAFITTALVATYPDKFSAAGHTSGGVSLTSGDTAPPSELASMITSPYIIHHGSEDYLVPLAADSAFNAVLNSNSTIHSYYTYENVGHDDLLDNATVLERTRSWFELYSCRVIASTNDEAGNDIRVYPVPTSSHVMVELSVDAKNLNIQCYDLLGQQVPIALSKTQGIISVDLSGNKPGIYFLHITIQNKMTIKKIILQP